MNLMEKISSFFESMTPKGLLAMSLIAGLLAFFLVFVALSGKGEEQAKEKTDLTMVKVVAAKTDITPRTEIKEEMLRVLELPQSAVPEDALKEMVSIVGKPAKVAIMAGDVITAKKLYSDKRAAGFPGVIPEDCRAITLAIDDVTGVAGFAMPGDYVDVMLVSDKLQNGAVTGEVVMQNVLLLGINKAVETASGAPSETQSKDKKDDKNKDKVQTTDGSIKTIEKPATATLAVRPEEAMRISVASKVGTLYLALRPFKPSNRYIMDTSYAITLDNGKAAAAQNRAATPAPAPVAAAPAPAANYSAPASGSSAQAAAPKHDRGVAKIEVIRGVQSTKE
ncbi:MAG: Flp pilus assembly protein CpaB [Selenomonadaceae bacterium]|nr:Flp pilus assembly protein CpaB [Selenomonadaceae bacterium]MBP3722868.1 Flp pilus assembly protein CpaB [Selenomonadaceae bacterium]